MVLVNGEEVTDWRHDAEKQETIIPLVCLANREAIVYVDYQ
jgi:hypothetical protein